MKLVIQRVKKASVVINNTIYSSIGKGIVLLAGFEKSDDHLDVEQEIMFIANKIVNLRIFEDANGKMNLSLKDINGELLVISNFTLAASIKKGRRPSFDNSLNPDEAKVLFEKLVNALKTLNINVKEGQFKSHMNVLIENDGPVTFIIER